MIRDMLSLALTIVAFFVGFHTHRKKDEFIKNAGFGPFVTIFIVIVFFLTLIGLTIRSL